MPLAGSSQPAWLVATKLHNEVEEPVSGCQIFRRQYQASSSSSSSSSIMVVVAVVDDDGYQEGGGEPPPPPMPSSSSARVSSCSADAYAIGTAAASSFASAAAVAAAAIISGGMKRGKGKKRKAIFGGVVGLGDCDSSSGSSSSSRSNSSDGPSPQQPTMSIASAVESLRRRHGEVRNISGGGCRNKKMKSQRLERRRRRREGHSLDGGRGGVDGRRWGEATPPPPPPPPPQMQQQPQQRSKEKPQQHKQQQQQQQQLGEEKAENDGGKAIGVTAAESVSLSASAAAGDGSRDPRAAPPTTAAAVASKSKSEGKGASARSDGHASDVFNDDKASKAAQASNSNSASASTLFRFSVATWNVWFGFGELGMNPHVEPRMKELVRLLREHDVGGGGGACAPLLFVGLQEVTLESLPIAVDELRVAGFGRIVMQRNWMQHFCVLAIRDSGVADIDIVESGWKGYAATENGRGFCYARVKISGGGTATKTGPTGGEILVATTHMESPKRNRQQQASFPWGNLSFPGGNDYRANQLLEWQDFCRDQFTRHSSLRACIFMGDTNWNDEDKGAKDFPMSHILGMPYKDAWLEYVSHQQRLEEEEVQPSGSRAGRTTRKKKKKERKCYTYDALLNPMLCAGGFRSRIDRCLIFFREDRGIGAPQNGKFGASLRTAEASTTCRDVRLLGQDRIPGLFFDKAYYCRKERLSVVRPFPTAPSDHFGLVVALEMELG